MVSLKGQLTAFFLSFGFVVMKNSVSRLQCQMGYLHFIILYNIRLSTFVTADFLCQLCFLSLKVVRRYLFLGIVFFKVPVPLFNCCKCGIREILVFVIFMMMMMMISVCQLLAEKQWECFRWISNLNHRHFTKE